MVFIRPARRDGERQGHCAPLIGTWGGIRCRTRDRTWARVCGGEERRRPGLGWRDRHQGRRRVRGYDLERRDSVAYPYCRYPAPIEVDCFSGSLTVDGVGAFVAKTFVVVTLIPINQTLIDSSVTTGTYQAISTCELQLVASGEPNGRALRSAALLSVTTDVTASVQHVWVYRGGTRAQACP